MRLLPGLFAVLLVTMAVGCGNFILKTTVDTTSKVLARGQPALKMESDYEMAARAIPGALKTVESFWVASPTNMRLVDILTEGYCQYGTAFVEDEIERAQIAGDREAEAYHSVRATKMFIRCMNYAFKRLGKKWSEDLFSTQEAIDKRIASASCGHRTPMMWAAVGLASAINRNKDRVEMISNIATAKAMLVRVVELDAKCGLPKDKTLAALPHVALGMAYTGVGEALGGNPKQAEVEFQTAIDVTEGKYLLAEVLMAKQIGFRMASMDNNGDGQKDDKDRELARKFYHDHLMKVLGTSPSIWPEQRLANEIAHRRARRYLSQEKEIFE